MSVSLNGVPRVMTNLGSFLGRTYDPSLLQMLGVPDVDGKDLTTLLVTDRLDDATIGLTKISTDVAAALADTGSDGVVLGTKAADFKKLVGENQVAITTEDLNQVVADYDLFLGTTKPVMLKWLSIKQPTTVTAGALTSISVQTDDATPGVIIDTTDGDVTNLLTESELSWTGAMRIEIGTKIQLSIAGGATGVAQSCKIAVGYEAIEDTGYLAPQE